MSLTIEQLSQMDKQVGDLRTVLSDMSGHVTKMHDKLKLAMLITAKHMAQDLIKLLQEIEPDADESDMELICSVYLTAYNVLSTYYGAVKSK